MNKQDEKKEEMNDAILLYEPLTSLASDNKNTLSIVSYNILYKDWVKADRYPYTSLQERLWKYRLPKIRKTISSFNADIICLQECDIDSAAFKKDIGDYVKNDGYDYVLPPCNKKVVPDDNGFGHWGCAVLFKSNKYKLQHKYFKSNRLMILLFTDLFSILNCSNCCNNDIINCGDSICIYHSFFVINVHLTGNPILNQKRFHEMYKLLIKLENYMKCKSSAGNNNKKRKKNAGIHINIDNKSQNMRIFICGDFNSSKCGIIDDMLVNNHCSDGVKCDNNNIINLFKFNDCLNDAILSNYKINKTNNNNNNNNNKFEAFYDRLEWFPTFGNGIYIGGVDFIYYTSNNIKLIGVIKTLNNKFNKKNIHKNIKILQNKHDNNDINNNEENMYERLKKLEKNLLCLPNNEIPSDHLPIGAKFLMKNICPKRAKCDCCNNLQLQSKKNKKNIKKKNKKKIDQTQTRTSNNWIFWSITSF